MTRPPSKQLDFNDPVRCLASQVRRLNRLLTNAFEREMAESGVTPSQFFILTAIGRMNGTATAAVLAMEFDFERSTLSRTLARMHDAGWLEEVGREGLNVYLGLTAAGDGKRKVATKRWRRAQAMALAALGERTANTLSKALEKAQTL